MTDEEIVARFIAAKKMGLVRDKTGARLPDDLWSQSLPDANQFLAILTALSWQKIEPGSVVVPVEPTEDIIFAMQEAFKKTRVGSGAIGMTIDNQFRHECAREFAAYRAMIAAATKKPASGGDADGPGST